MRASDILIVDQGNPNNDFDGLFKAVHRSQDIEKINMPKTNIHTVIGKCDYRCSAEKCSHLFHRLFIYSKTSQILLLHPVLGIGQIEHDNYFFRILSMLSELSPAMMFLQRLDNSPFMGCSTTWPIHISSPIFKIAKIQKVIISNCERRYSGSYLADIIHWCPGWLSQCFSKYCRIPLTRFITRIKMCQALWMIISTDKSMKSISYDIGYKDELYFSKSFKSVFNVSPSQIRKEVFQNRVSKTYEKTGSVLARLI